MLYSEAKQQLAELISDTQLPMCTWEQLLREYYNIVRMAAQQELEAAKKYYEDQQPKEEA